MTFFGGGLDQATPSYAQEFLLEMLGGPQEMPGIETRLVVCKEVVYLLYYECSP